MGRQTCIESLEPRRLLAATMIQNDIFPRHLTVVGDQLLFTAEPDDSGHELWRTDGTTQSTTLVKDLDSKEETLKDSTPLQTELLSPRRNFVAVGEVLYFAGEDETGPGLFRSDGSSKSTVKIASTANAITRVLAAGTMLVFTDGKDVWRSDGTSGGTVQLTSKSLGLSRIVELAAIDQTIYFSAFDSTSPTLARLVRSGGSAASTRVFKSFDVPKGRYIFYLQTVGHFLMFQAPTANGESIWYSDGTTKGTAAFWTNPSPDTNALTIGPFTFQGALYFTTSDSSGQSLWRSDGSNAGTIELKHFTDLPINFTNQSHVPRFGAIGSTLLFTFSDDRAIPGTELHLWKTDGTAQGTGAVKDFAEGKFVDVQGSILSTKKAIFFFCEGFLIRSDGKAVSTKIIGIAGENVGGYTESLTGPELTVFHDQIYFVTYHALWTSPLNPGEIHGVVFADENQNGVKDPDEIAPQKKRTVWIDLNNDGEAQYNEPSTIARPDGSFTINGLDAGTYSVHASLPEGWKSTTPDPLPVSVKLGGVKHILLGQHRATHILGTVFDDSQREEGRYDGSQPGIAGTRVYLDLNNDGMSEEGEPFFRTDSKGRYAFDDLHSGTYYVRQSPFAGYHFTTPDFYKITLLPGDAATDRDFGNAVPPVTVRGLVYDNANADGVYQQGEHVFNGIEIVLDLNNNGVLNSPAEDVQSTSRTGHYLFTTTTLGLTTVRANPHPVLGLIPTTPATVQIALKPGKTRVVNFGFRHGT